MNNIPVKLLQQPPAYNFFENNQVLTAEQLNNFIQQLDYQDRLTRVCLTGCGIVCGLRIFFNRTGLIITKGCGVTSDGDLIRIDTDVQYSSIIPFLDKNAGYSFFKGAVSATGTSATSATDSKIFEMLPSTSQDPDAVPVNNFFTGAVSPSDFVVLLYLEQYLKDLDDCTSDDCDHKGISQESNLKVILIPKTIYESVKKQNDCCGDDYFDLPEVSVKRVIFNPANSFFSYREISDQYNNAILDAAGQLSKALQAADKTAQPLINCFLKNGNFPDNFKPALGNEARINNRLLAAAATVISSAAFEEKIKVFRDSAKPVPGIQYVYDFIKDIAEAYHEFRESISELCQSCCLPADQFPKHLSLGLLEGNDPLEPCQFRQCFIESPVLNHKDDDLVKAILLYQRLVTMLKTFRFGINVQDFIKITPSAAISKSITEKAIPYYYTPGAIHHYWNPAKTAKLKADCNLSYHADQYSQKDFVIEPLEFDLDKYDFFRIEGHIGKKYDDVFPQLDRVRQQQDLPFDIVGLQLQLERKTIVPKRPFFPDNLDLLLETHRFSYEDHLDKTKLYQEALIRKIPESAELIPEETTDHYGNVNDIRNATITSKLRVDSQIVAAKAAMARPIQELDDDHFSNLHLTLMKEAGPVHKGAEIFTRKTYITPVENLSLQLSPHILDWLKKIRTEKENKVKDGFVFINYLKEHPALQHYGGVPKGGTFILLYENTDGKRTVMADFYLPYIIANEYAEPKVQIPKIPLRPSIPFDELIIKDYEKPPLKNKDVLLVRKAYLKDIEVVRNNVSKMREDTTGEILLMKNEVKGDFKKHKEETDLGIKRMGDFANTAKTDMETSSISMNNRLEAVKNEVSEKLIKVDDNYRGSFEKLVTTYSNVLAGAAVTSGAASPPVTATPASPATTVAAPPERTTEVVAKNLATFKVEEIENELEARTLRLRMEKTLALMKRRFPNG